MNTILIVCDTLRRDHLGCYGNTWIDTRHIDAFAQRSLVFDRAYSASFPTVPHRRDVMTGRYTFTYAAWAPLTPEETVLADVLSAHGVTTMMVCEQVLELSQASTQGSGSRVGSPSYFPGRKVISES